MDCKFYAVSCVGTPISFSLMARKKAATFTSEERAMAFKAVLEKTKKVDRHLQGVLLHLMNIGRFASVDDETQDMFLGPRTQRVTYNMPEFTLVPCFEDLKEETLQLTIHGGLLSIDHVKLIARADILIKVSVLSFPDAGVIFKERPNECVEAYIPSTLLDNVPDAPATEKAAGTSKKK
ncbi:matrix protein [Alphacytorhabdovirus sambuci]|uniref:Matrix protein n=1 Tax=Sambucus cytorhabdovirus TaxID=2944624 RepID=A0AAE9KYC2_9RHAB|nr:matrix protein [Sambucus cytorhabdovirus]UQU68821.1 matrix protein [Sambucus cytorhabdovirus]